jgi:hypothetical protein
VSIDASNGRLFARTARRFRLRRRIECFSPKHTEAWPSQLGSDQIRRRVISVGFAVLNGLVDDRLYLN